MRGIMVSLKDHPEVIGEVVDVGITVAGTSIWIMVTENGSTISAPEAHFIVLDRIHPNKVSIRTH